MIIIIMYIYMAPNSAPGTLLQAHDLEKERAGEWTNSRKRMTEKQ